MIEGLANGAIVDSEFGWRVNRQNFGNEIESDSAHLVAATRVKDCRQSFLDWDSIVDEVTECSAKFRPLTPYLAFRKLDEMPKGYNPVELVKALKGEVEFWVVQSGFDLLSNMRTIVTVFGFEFSRRKEPLSLGDRLLPIIKASSVTIADVLLGSVLEVPNRFVRFLGLLE